MGLISDLLDGAGAIIFDCDGTIVDSAPLYAKAWAAGFAASGHDMATDWYMARNGLSEHLLMDSFEAAAGISLDRKQVVETVRTAFLDGIDSLRACDRIARLARAASALMPIAVASGGPAAIVLPSLRQIGLLDIFEAVVTLDDIGVAKPAPDLFLEAARRLGMTPRACLVVEDSATGIDAAKAADMAWLNINDTAGVERLERQVQTLST